MGRKNPILIIKALFPKLPSPKAMDLATCGLGLHVYDKPVANKVPKHIDK